MIFGQGVVQLGVGMAVGLALALGISQLLKVVLFQVQPRDPVIFGGVAAVLVVVGLLACLFPARRATLVDPLVALAQRLAPVIPSNSPCHPERISERICSLRRDGRAPSRVKRSVSPVVDHPVNQPTTFQS